MSIFDSIINSVSSLGDSLDGFDWIGAAGTALKGSGKSSDDSMSNSYSMLALSKKLYQNTDMPYSTNGMKASKSQPLASVDPDEIQNAWLRRLGRYSQITNDANVGMKR